MNGAKAEVQVSEVRPGRIRTVSWQEEISENEINVPGSPKTPRTSTTPGIIDSTWTIPLDDFSWMFSPWMIP
ncbi:GTP cyclohydrolase i [Nesidiocoris tenuis]|uniref:GTP cyclohydrolase i n=1 Tax=Nesidiocoris tenuis TaxID=355587 RepID=A0ABN7A9F1_9HEMI|nr:GTP cyclohydrolase i [Nesidiocoris tenuis]